MEPTEVLYQDESLIAVAKPPGILVHRSSEARADPHYLLQLVRDQVGRLVYPAHRLDRNTSGVVLFALGSDEARALQERLQASDARKEYLVLVRGSTPERFESRRPLSGKEAWTEFTKLAELSRSSLLRARLHTGRRHQIRRHLDHLGHQVIGDTRYGKGKINRFLRDTYGLPRMVLHAERVTLRHPLQDTPLQVHAPLATDLRAYLGRLPDVDPALVASL
jgi:tRNA pseudouridine65 synthase